MVTRPRSHPHPSSSRVARDHRRACSGRSMRGGHTSAASRARASASCRSSASNSMRAGAPSGRLAGAPAPSGGRETKHGGAATRQSGEWSGRGRSSHRSRRALRGRARARRHTRRRRRRTPSSATRPSRHLPNTRDRGPHDMRVRIGEAADRRLPLSPLRQLDPQRAVKAAHVRPGQRAAHAARSASRTPCVASSDVSPVDVASRPLTCAPPAARAARAGRKRTRRHRPRRRGGVLPCASDR